MHTSDTSSPSTAAGLLPVVRDGAIHGISPVDLRPLAPIPVASADDVRTAVERSRKAQAGWAARRFDERVEALRRAAKLLPDDAGVRNNLGVAHLAAGSPAEAEGAFRAALAWDPANLRARNNLGFALARQQRDDDALVSFRAAGDEGTARYNLGLACELRGDVPAALVQYHAALAARPDDPATRTALARLLPPPAPLSPPPPAAPPAPEPTP